MRTARNSSSRALLAAAKLPSGVPKSYKDCAKIKEYPSTPFAVPPFQEPYKQAPIKAKTGSTCNADSCLDVYEYNEEYVPDYALVPRSICPGGTKMLMYDGIFPGPTVTAQFGRQVRTLDCDNMHLPCVGGSSAVHSQAAPA